MTIFGQLLLAWLIGMPAIVLSGEVDERWAALILPAGLLLVGTGIRMLVDDRGWQHLLAQAARRGRAYPATPRARIWLAVVTSLIGCAWTVVGVPAVL